MIVLGNLGLQEVFSQTVFCLTLCHFDVKVGRGDLQELQQLP